MIKCVYSSRQMDIQEALIAFDALSQETRLRTFRLLIKKGAKGSAAGEISKKLGIPHNTLSFHLSHMSNAGLITPRREGRSIIYTANFEFGQELIQYMVVKCCAVEFVDIKDSKINPGGVLIELASPHPLVELKKEKSK